jgi:hypothetical protein
MPVEWATRTDRRAESDSEQLLQEETTPATIIDIDTFDDGQRKIFCILCHT